MNNNNKIWPSEEDLNSFKSQKNKNNKKYNLAPFAVVYEYSDLLYEHYDRKLLGIITTKSKITYDQQRTDFVHSLILSETNENPVQIKIFEIKVQDDGWYPAKVSVADQSVVFGNADNEEDLRKFLQEVINSDFVKEQILTLLKNSANLN